MGMQWYERLSAFAGRVTAFTVDAATIRGALGNSSKCLCYESMRPATLGRMQ